MNRDLQNKREESGQIIILLALSLLVLLIVAAMAVDGGMIYSDRRFGQNAADASSLAGVGWLGNYLANANLDDSNSFNCTLISSLQLNIYEQAKIRANSNNIAQLPYEGIIVNGAWIPYSTTDAEGNVTTGALDSKNGVILSCVDQDNPDNDPKEYLDVLVRTTTETPTAFLHLIIPGTVKNTVEAVSRFETRHTVGYGVALLSDTNQDECKVASECGIVFTGGSTTYVTDGSIRSDSIIDAENNSEIYVDNGSVSSYDYIQGQDSFSVTDGTMVENDEPYYEDIVVNFYESDCDTLYEFDSYDTASVSKNDDPLIITPGKYSLIENTGGELYIKPGIYCVKGGGIKLTGGVTEVVDSDFPVNNAGDAGVTFFMIDGGVTVNATGEGERAVLFAQDQSIDPLGGWLIVYDPANNSPSNPVKITGGGESYFAGGILVPDGEVTIEGSADVNPEGESIYQDFNTMIIAKKIIVAGSAVVDIDFDSSKVPDISAMINLHR